MKSMFTLTEKEQEALERLSERIRQLRVQREPIKDFAARIGVSAPTYSKLEKADPTVALGVLIRALSLTGNLQNLEKLFVARPIDEMFDSTLPPRQRAAKRRRAPRDSRS